MAKRLRAASLPVSPSTLCAHLQPVLERLLAAGATVAYPLWKRSDRRYRVVIYGNAATRALFDARNQPAGLEIIESVGFLSYHCEPCRHYIDQPRREEPSGFDPKELTPPLRTVYKRELKLGNTLHHFSRDWSDCPLAVSLSNALHFEQIAEEMELPANIVRWESWDTRYALETGLRCTKTRQTLAGTPPLYDTVPGLLRPVLERLIKADYDALQPLCREGTIDAAALKRAVDRFRETLTEIPAAALSVPQGSGAQSLTIHPAREEGATHFVLCVDLWTLESTRAELYLVLSLDTAGKKPRLTVEYLGDDPLPATEKAMSRCRADDADTHPA